MGPHFCTDLSDSSDSDSDSVSSKSSYSIVTSSKPSVVVQASPVRAVLSTTSLPAYSVISSTSSVIEERSVAATTNLSYLTPSVSKKKIIRRTNAQIEIDAASKKAAAVAKAELAAAKEALKKKAEPSVEISTVELKGKKYSVQPARTNWTVAEQISLINCYKKWEVICEKSQDKKLMQVSKMWLTEIPSPMGKEYGKVRLTPSNSLGSSPYKAKWQDIRKKVSDYKAAQPDGREEELPDIEGPTGGGCDENGIEDERMERAEKVEVALDMKRNDRYTGGVDRDSLTVIEHFMKLYPQSISGIGLMSEKDLVTGAGRKRECCDIAGLENTVGEGGVSDVPPVKKASKSSLILDLTRTVEVHHEENMNFQRSYFEYEKESRLADIVRHVARDAREVEYRERQDIRDQERYVAEQARLASAQQDTKDINNVFASFLTNIIAKL